MVKIILNKTSVFIMAVIAIVYFDSCNGQSQNSDTCITHLKNARRNLNAYYKSNDQSSLAIAMNEVEQSMQCDKTKRGAIELKLSLLILLNQYQHGYQYVDSLGETDFKLKYKKGMWQNFFLALECESKFDTVGRNKYYNNIIPIVENYIQSENKQKGQIDEEPYYDLFFIKAKVSDPKQIDFELDSLKQKYPSEGDFFEGLKSTFLNIAGKSNARPSPQ
ncbi:MAG: hypothetical protein JST47_10965 [Bacteroidetes bacterium]|nr:hypothetical protein [Bacteroidota bacterium]MBS1975306.1 hypothetical protein [Bacteroidota bacterium]